MSAQFGRWSFRGEPISREFLGKVKAMVSLYGPDPSTSYSEADVHILYYPFHTTRESRREIQPHLLPSGAILTWDGRLDNREEMLRSLGRSTTEDPTDVAIVAQAWERWDIESFSKLVGDWALSVWNPVKREIVLARDPIGLRALYYASDSGSFTWSSILDPLVLLSGKTFEIEQEYIAGWLGSFPASHLTPYAGIAAVPAASFLRADTKRVETVRYWELNPSRRIRYRTDGEYEEHFRVAFETAVKRRLRSDGPVLAELSGGMDSSSIVCVADRILARGNPDAPRLDTISYYDDSEPSWNERPYFTIVEKKRGRTGCHIDLSQANSAEFTLMTNRFLATPSSRGRGAAVTEQLRAALSAGPIRIILSGVGGDEFTGGLPTPIPELADLLARARASQLAGELKQWALAQKKPWVHLLRDVLKCFLPADLVGVPELRRPAPWLEPGFVHRYSAALTGYEQRIRLFGPLPSFQEFRFTLEAIRRQLGCAILSPELLLEKRYPYLDRDFLEFLSAIPREQLVRPRERRSLMRRALVGIVPEQLLNRKRKAFVARSPRAAIDAHWESLRALSHNMVSASLGIVNAKAFEDALARARSGVAMSIVPVIRTIQIELWLRNVHSQTAHGATPQEAVSRHGSDNILTLRLGEPLISGQNSG